MPANNKTVNKLTAPTHPVYKIISKYVGQLAQSPAECDGITKQLVQHLQRDGHIRYTAKKHTNADTVNESVVMKSRRLKTEYIEAHPEQTHDQMFEGMQHMGIIKKNANRHDNILSITKIMEKLEMEAA